MYPGTSLTCSEFICCSKVPEYGSVSGRRVLVQSEHCLLQFASSAWHKTAYLPRWRHPLIASNHMRNSAFAQARTRTYVCSSRTERNNTLNCIVWSTASQVSLHSLSLHLYRLEDLCSQRPVIHVGGKAGQQLRLLSYKLPAL